MKIRTFAYVLLLLMQAPMLVHAQLWQSLGGGVNDDTYSLFPDTVSGLLYVGGWFDRAGDSTVCRVAAWDGQDWNRVGIATGDTACPFATGYAYSVVKLGDKVFASGAFLNFSGSSTFNYLIHWDGVSWDTMAKPDGFAYFEITNGELLGMGPIHTLNGAPVGRIIRWNGLDAWESFGPSLPFVPDEGWMFTSEYSNGRYYFGGNFTIPGFLEIASWDGTAWSPVGGGIHGDAWVNKLKFFHGQLFVGGEFLQGAGNASSYLTAWDGSNWYNPFPLVQFTTQVRDMQVIDGRLYILGTHYVWNGSGWQGPYQIAHYDGQEFSSFGGMDIFPRDVAGLDGHLYVTTGYYLHADPYGGVAEWIGGDSVDIAVSQPVRVQDPEESALAVKLFPNPATQGFSLQLPQGFAGCSLKVVDLAGHAALASREYLASGPPVDVSMLPAGTYLVEVALREGRQVVKLIKE